MLERLRHRWSRADGAADDLSVAEAYRILRANLTVAVSEIDRPIVLFTSALKGEGKTSTVANLAPLLAVAGMRVVVADLDLRHPRLHEVLGVGNARGATDVLRGTATLSDCLQYVVVKSEDEEERGIYVLTSGPLPPNPAELVGGRRAARTLEALAAQSDIVLVDSPPVLPVADSLTLARACTGVVLVVEARRTPIPAVSQAKDTLIRNQARLLGVVVSKLPRADARSLAYGPATYGDGEA
jgi:capsular exopolysaccharide synthesis family protein